MFHFPAMSAIIADSLSPEHRGRGMATMNTVSGSVAIFAPYVAGLLLDHYGIDLGMRILYSAMAIAYLASGTIERMFIRETRDLENEHISLANASGILKDAYSGVLGLLRRFSVPMRALSVILILGFVMNGIASPFWVVYAQRHLGLSSSEWGLVLLIESVARSLSGIPAGFIVDRFGRTRFIVAALVMGAVLVLSLIHI